MMKLFKPQIIELLFERDATVAAWKMRHPDRNVYEDRELDITSHCRISVEDRFNGVDAALLFAAVNEGATYGLLDQEDTAGTHSRLSAS